MAIEDIIHKIESATETKIKEILTSAKEEEKNILTQTEIEAEKIKKRILETGKKELAEKKSRQITITTLEARKTLLAEKQKIISEIYTEVLKKIEGLPKNEYSQLLKGLVLKLANGGEEIIVAERDKSKIDSNFLKDVNRELAKKGKKSLTFSSVMRNIPGGFLLRSGESEINVSLPLLIKSLRETTESQLVKVLFSNSSP
ncbi:MAG TPA: hypothetical protein DHV62_04455 [Elusimicrobia bacterium]|jgi:V/A-type H+-transporting ATPase subunit E|nr:hypothetical protein [Elusimicrobiota bacterium]